MRLRFFPWALLGRTVRPLSVVLPLLGLSACFGFTSPKGVSNSTGSTTGGTTGNGSAFVDETAASNSALIDFDGTLVEVAGAARLKATRFLMTATSTSELVTAGAEFDALEVSDGAIQLKTRSSIQRRDAAFNGLPQSPYMALTLDSSSAYPDRFGADNDGSCVPGPGTCPTSTAGVIGNGARFSASTNPAIGIANAGNFAYGTAPRGMCVWAKPDVPTSDTGYHWAMSYGQGVDNGAFALGVQRPGGLEPLRLMLSTYGFGHIFSVQGATASDALDGEWVHLCATFNDPDSGGPIKGIFALWINGAQAGTQEENFDLGGMVGNMGPSDVLLDVAYIGDQVTGGERWLGDLDEPVIFSTPGTETDEMAATVAQLYRYTQDAVFQEEGSVSSPVFDAGPPWPWSAVVVGVEAPYSNNPRNTETGFGARGFNNTGNTLLALMDEDSNPLPDRSPAGRSLLCVAGKCPSYDPEIHTADFDGIDDILFVQDSADTLVANLKSVCVHAALDDSAFTNYDTLQTPPILLPYSTLISFGQAGQSLDIGRFGGQLYVGQFAASPVFSSKAVWNTGADLAGGHTICVTRDDATMRAYVDGDEVLNSAQFGSFPVSGNSAFIGARIPGSAEFWAGTISMVSAWDRVISLDEIKGISQRNRFYLGMQFGTAPSGTPAAITGPSEASTFYTLSDGVAGDFSYSLNLPINLTPQPRLRAAVTVSTADANQTPRITSIEALPAKLPASALVTAKTASTYTTLTSFTAELPAGTTGQVKFRLLKGSETLFWNGTSWAVAGATDGASAADINAHLGEFVSAKGAGEVKWQALLLSVDQRQPAGLLRVTLTGVR